MKRILMAVLMLGVTGGVYAAEFGDLAVNASDLKVSAISIPIPKAADTDGQLRYTAMTDQEFANSVMLLPKGLRIIQGGGFLRLVTVTESPMSKDDAESLLSEWQLRLKLNAGVEMAGSTLPTSNGYIVVLAFGKASLQTYRPAGNNATSLDTQDALKLAKELRQEGVKVIAPAVDEFGGLCLVYTIN